MTKEQRRKLDKLWAKKIRKDFCEKCLRENKQFHSAHIVPRTVWATRWDIKNGVNLCYRCHFHWAHKDPMAFIEWVKESKPITYEYLELKRHSQQKNDYFLIKAYLEGI